MWGINDGSFPRKLKRFRYPGSAQNVNPIETTVRRRNAKPVPIFFALMDWTASVSAQINSALAMRATGQLRSDDMTRHRTVLDEHRPASDTGGIGAKYAQQILFFFCRVRRVLRKRRTCITAR